MAMTVYDRSKCVITRKTVKAPPADAGQNAPACDRIKCQSVGYVDRVDGEFSIVFVVGKGKRYRIPNATLEPIDPTKYTAYNKKTTPGKKVCLTCHRLLAQSEFPKNQNNKRGSVTRPHCEPCYRKIAGKNLSASAKERFKRYVGAPKDGDLWQCQICRKYSIAGVNAEIRVDHDHKTGNARAVICDSCNTGIGRLQNGQELLSNALQYIRKHDARQPALLPK